MMHANGIPGICIFAIAFLTGQGFECISYLVQYLQQIEIKFSPPIHFLAPFPRARFLKSHGYQAWSTPSHF